MEIKYNNKVFKAGQRVKAIINGYSVTNGMIYYNGHMWFFLHNNSAHNGSRPDNMFNYTYSWAFRDNDGYLTDGVDILEHADDVKEFFEVQEQFSKFLKERIDISFLEKKDVIKNASQIYSLYTSGDSKYGFVKFINEKGNVTEMKFGRFLTCYINDVKKFYEKDLSLDAKTIEKYHNEYISHQKESNIKIEFLQGEDILQGYTRDNYHENCGRISGSCMTNKQRYLKLYTQNENVKLLAVKMDNKFIGRALVWETNKGSYLDSVYTTQDWVYSIFNYIRRDKGYLVASETEEITVPVNTDGIDEFPYLDTFFYLTPDGKTLYNHNNTKPCSSDHERGTKVLRHTGGGYTIVEN